MNRALAGTLLSLLASGWAIAQSDSAKPEFEVASIKPAEPRTGGPMRVGSTGGPGTKDPTRVAYENMSLSNLVSIAYDLKRYQLTAPSWLDGERFNIQAKVPEGATKEQARVMLQNLLAERFKLEIHRETKEVAGFQLVVGKNGHKLKEAVELPPPDSGPPVFPPGPPKMDKNGFPDLPPGRSMTMMMNGRAKTQGQQTMEQFATMLANQLGRPVTDATGLKGKFEISLYWSSDNGLGGGPPPPPPPGAAGPVERLSDGESGPNIYSAVQEQLGLRLESKKAPVEILVVDRIEKTPTEN